jgi:hypothetical protein
MNGSAAVSRPVGRLVAAAGATLLAFVFATTSIVAVIWALATLLGLPDFLMWVLLALGAVPIIWTTLWTAGRAWHVEKLLEKGHDVDQPLFRVGAYFRKRAEPAEQAQG